MPAETQPVADTVRGRIAQRINEQERGTVDAYLLASVARAVFRELEEEGADLGALDREALTQQAGLEMLRLGPIFQPMIDPTVTEVMVNGPDTIFIEKNGVRFRYGPGFEDERTLRALVARMVETAPGKRVDEAAPMVDLSLPDGSRVNIAIPPVVVGGPQVTIRKYMRSLGSIDDLVARETLDTRMGAFLKACVQTHIAILFSGASGSGKTTLMEILTQEIAESERIVVIEDTLELRFQQPNVVRMLTRAPNIEGFGQITTSECFHNSLRMRPSRIILGELRGTEAFDYLQALNSGHRGSLAVIHASSPEEAALRTENLAMIGDRHVPISVVRQQLAHGLDLIVQMEQLADGTRKVTRIAQLTRLGAEGEVIAEDIFRYVPEGIRDDGVVVGHFEATGVIPYFLDQIQLEGALLGASLFDAG